eukprot:8813291-Pyramimonas_sp.AAC.1
MHGLQRVVIVCYVSGVKTQSPSLRPATPRSAAHVTTDSQSGFLQDGVDLQIAEPPQLKGRRIRHEPLHFMTRML